MSDITLTQLEVRTSGRNSWLHLRTVVQCRDTVRGHLRILVPLTKDPNYGCAQTLFDPDSPYEDVMFSCRATGSLALECGCSRDVLSIATEERSDQMGVAVRTEDVAAPGSPTICCRPHRRFDHEWSQSPDPLLWLAWVITLEELAVIRACISARREGVAPVSLAGMCGAAGVRTGEVHAAMDPSQIETLALMAGLRNHRLMQQRDPDWFRVR